MTQILMIEDDRVLQRLVVEELEFAGYEVTAVSNGLDAMRHLSQPAVPAVILVDLMMPLMSGWEVLHEITLDRRLARTPVVVLTALGEELSSTLRVFAFLRKPFDVDLLLATVARAVRTAPTA